MTSVALGETVLDRDMSLSVTRPSVTKRSELNSDLSRLIEASPKQAAISETRMPVSVFEHERAQGLHHYLERAVKAKHINAEMASIAWRVWRALSNATLNKLPVPNAGVGPDGQILYTWKQNEHHFEVEIFLNGIGEFFYLNLKTNEMWDCEYTVGDLISEEIKARLEFYGSHG